MKKKNEVCGTHFMRINIQIFTDEENYWFAVKQPYVIWDYMPSYMTAHACMSSPDYEDLLPRTSKHKHTNTTQGRLHRQSNNKVVL